MAVQLTYSASLPAGFPGLLIDNGHFSQKTAAVQGEASAEVPFGVFITKAASGSTFTRQKAVLLSAATNPIFGAVLHGHSYNRETDLGTVGLKPGTVLTVLESGTLWMLAEAPMTEASAVYARFATGAGGSVRGALRPDADTATAALVKGARLLGPTQSVTVLNQSYLIAPVEFSALLQKATS